MKTSLLLAVAVFAMASLLSSCQQEGQSITGPGMVLPLKNSPPPAQPAIAYINSGVGVMDTTGANATIIVTGTALTPSWNYDGSSIAYQSGAAIKAVDVSVNSKGVPVGSNVRTVYSFTPSDSINFTSNSGPAWCATSSVGEIAFTRVHISQAERGLAELCVVSQSGGTPTVLATFKKLSSSNAILGLYSCPTWSPDDSKIAVSRIDTNNHCTILIFNASTGAAEDSIPLSGAISHMEWSRSGQNELEYSFYNGSGYYIYYVTPTTGSTPTTNSVACGSTGTWSPNNSGIMFDPPGAAMEKLMPFSTSATTVGTSSYSYLNWKR